MPKEFESYPVLTVSSNMFYAPLLAVNPHVGLIVSDSPWHPCEVVADFPELLKELFTPSEAAARRALAFTKVCAFVGVAWPINGA
eukprot:4982720-Amphidinium_carterae.2